MNGLITSLVLDGKGRFPCPSCGAMASDNYEYPHCPNGCTEPRMLAALAARPPRCEVDHDPYREPASKCPQCRFEVAWAAAEGERRVRTHRLDLLRRAVAEGLDSSTALRRFPLYSASQVARRETLPDTLPGVLGPPGTVTEVTGYRGSGKSLWVHAMGQAVAHGIEEFAALPLRLSGPVLYVAREGVPGWTRRVAAWAAYHGVEDAGERLTFMHEPIDITRAEDAAALSALLIHTGAVMLVLDPVAMTGGGKEDEENYSAYRAAALELASERDVVAVLLTNTGHAVRWRGRNSSMLVDGMDTSVALVKDERTRVVTVTPNKERDMAALGDLRLRFEGAGARDPDTGRYLSGVWVPLTKEDKEALAAESIARELDRLNRALDLAGRVLLGCCDCRQGAEGAREFPTGCGRGVSTEKVAAEIGLDLADRERSKAVKHALWPAIEGGYVRSVGRTRGLRWHWGRGEEARV